MVKSFYEVPVEVMFWDCDRQRYSYGIAYRAEVISAECGGIFEINEVVINTPKGKWPIVAATYWQPFDEEISHCVEFSADGIDKSIIS